MGERKEESVTQDAGASPLDESINSRIEARFQELSTRLNLPEVEATVVAQRRSLRRAAFLTAGVGLAFAILFLISYWLGESLQFASATDEEIVNFYASPARQQSILIGAYVMPFAGIAFLWFIVALRMWISASTRKIDTISTNLQLVSGILFVGLYFAAGAAISAPAFGVEYLSGPINPDVARQLPQYGLVLLLIFVNRMAAIFVFTTSNIGRISQVLPRWFAWSGYAVGLFLLLSSAFTAYLALVFPLWMIVFSVILLLRARAIPKDAVLERGARTER